MEYDYIIIGAGISGLYTGYLIKKNNPNSKILILESNNYIGGRMGIDTFYSTRITTGAGIGRKNKDINLIKLLNELKIVYNEFKINTILAENITEIDITKIMKQLKTEYDTNKDIKKSIMLGKVLINKEKVIAFSDMWERMTPEDSGRDGPARQILQNERIVPKGADITLNYSKKVDQGKQKLNWKKINKWVVECNVCRINTADTKLNPCGHLLCSTCFFELPTPKKCYFCNTTPVTSEKIFYGGYYNKLQKYINKLK